MVSGIKDRLSEEAVKIYTDPKLKAWQMDLYRIGLQHGVSADEIRNITQSGSDWITARRQMTDAINIHRQELGKQIEAAGFKPNKDMVRKLEQFNHLTGKDNICEYNELKEAGKLQDKTPVERSLDTAAGHPENASVQAARRMLEKRGIDWETELIKREFKTCGYLATDKTVSHMKNITKETGNIKLKDVEEMYKGIRPVSPEVKADVEAIAMDCRAQEMARAAVNCL